MKPSGPGLLCVGILFFSIADSISFLVISLSNFLCLLGSVLMCCRMEKEMATYSKILAWGIPQTGEPGGLPSVGSHRVGHD